MLPSLVALLCTSQWPPVFESTKLTNHTLQALFEEHPPMKEWLTSQVITNPNIIGSSVGDIVELYTQLTKKATFHIDVELIVLTHLISDLRNINWDLVDECRHEINSYVTTYTNWGPIPKKKGAEASATNKGCVYMNTDTHVGELLKLRKLGYHLETKYEVVQYILAQEKRITDFKETRMKIDGSGVFDSYPPPPPPARATVAVAVAAA